MNVKEVEKETGFDRRDISRLKKEGLVESSGSYGGENGDYYQTYDEVAVDRLKQIKFLKDLDVPHHEIVEIMNSPEYDRLKVLNEIEARLLDKKKEIDDKLTIVSWLKQTKLRRVELKTALIPINGFSELAKYIKASEYVNIDYEALLQETPEEEQEKVGKLLEKIFRLKGEPVEAESVQQAVSDLFEKTSAYPKFTILILLFLNAIVDQYDAMEEKDKIYDKEDLQFLRNAILIWFDRTIEAKIRDVIETKSNTEKKTDEEELTRTIVSTIADYFEPFSSMLSPSILDFLLEKLHDEAKSEEQAAAQSEVIAEIKKRIDQREEDRQDG